MTNVTDFRKTVESGVDLHLTSSEKRWLFGSKKGLKSSFN